MKKQLKSNIERKQCAPTKLWIRSVVQDVLPRHYRMSPEAYNVLYEAVKKMKKINKEKTDTV
jgi:hypothetical protein